MKKFLVSALIVVLFPAFAIASNSKVDLLLKYLQQDSGSQKAFIGKAVKSVGGVKFVSVLIKTDDKKQTIDSIETLGGKIIFSLRTIIGAEIPLNAVDLLAQNDEVQYIEADRPLAKKMNDARIATSASNVNSGGYKGAGVVVGVVDDGIDYDHADFLNTDGDTRFQYIEWSNSSGTTAGSCTKDQIDGGSCDLTPGKETDGSATYHGTHVTGIATGSNATYMGVAPEADIIFYRSWGDGDSDGDMATAVIDGVQTIFEKATELKEAAVVNLSLGTSIGAHDGTSLLEEGLDELVEDGSGALLPGRIIVNAAGNENTIESYKDEGFGGIHAGFSLAEGVSQGFRAFVATSNDSQMLDVDVWLRSGSLDGCEISVYAFKDASTANPTLGTADVGVAWGDFNEGTDTNQITDVKITITKDGNTAKPRAFISIAGQSTSWSDYTYVIAVKSVSGSCVGDMWLYPDQISYNIFQADIPDATTNTVYDFDYADGDALKTLTIPSTANNVICVGAYFQEKPYGEGVSEWTDMDGNLQSEIPNRYGSVLDDMAGFSSLGPRADGVSKPDVVAPGEPIISTLASGVALLQDKYMISTTHGILSGTSMSSPHVAGIVALLLEKNTCLTVDDVKTALKTGTSTTGLTAQTDTAGDTYGAGKVNAKSAIDSILKPATQCHKGGGNVDPAVGSSGCGGSIMPVTNQMAGLIASLFVLPALLMFIRRRKKMNSSKL